MHVTRHWAIHARLHRTRFLFTLNLSTLLWLQLPLHFKPLLPFFPFHIHTGWTIAARCDLHHRSHCCHQPCHTLSWELGLTSAASLRCGLLALWRSTAIHPADFIKWLVNNNGSLNQLGKFMELCKSLIIAIASVTASVNIHKHAHAEASLCNCVLLPANLPASGPGWWQYREDGNVWLLCNVHVHTSIVPKWLGIPSINTATIRTAAKARPFPDCPTSVLQN